MQFRNLICVLLAATFLFGLMGCSDKELEKYKAPSSKTESVDNRPDNPIDFNSLKSDCADVVGWININDTVIDYPILQSSPDKEEGFYLSRDMQGKYLKKGCIYIERCNNSDFSNPNTLIYGHNMKNGSMFGTLKKYRNKKYFNEHRSIRICVPNHILDYEVVSAFVYDDRHIINAFNFFNDEEYQKFIDGCLSPKSLVKNVAKDAAITTNDRLITLSTCTSNKGERYLVVAKLVKDTETK